MRVEGDGYVEVEIIAIFSKVIGKVITEKQRWSSARRLRARESTEFVV